MTEFNYAECYDTLYKAGYHADHNYSHAKQLCRWLRENCEFNSILDIGCSHGWVLKYFADKRAVGVDPSCAAVMACKKRGARAFQYVAHDLAGNFSDFDVVISTDCFEHIHPDHVAESIRQACTLARKYVAMKISPRLDGAHWKNLVGHSLHLTVQPIEWWEREFLKYGGEVIHRAGDDTFVIKY